MRGASQRGSLHRYAAAVPVRSRPPDAILRVVTPSLSCTNDARSSILLPEKRSPNRNRPQLLRRPSLGCRNAPTPIQTRHQPRNNTWPRDGSIQAPSDFPVQGWSRRLLTLQELLHSTLWACCWCCKPVLHVLQELHVQARTGQGSQSLP